MTSSQNKEFMRQFLAASIDSNQESYKELLAPDFVAHLANGSQNRETFLLHNNVFNLAFSDRQISVKDLIVEDDRIVARVVWSGTHSNTFRDLPATGKKIVINAFIVERVKDGKSVEHWSLFDQLSMMQQLGVLPS